MSTLAPHEPRGRATGQIAPRPPTPTRLGPTEWLVAIGATFFAVAAAALTLQTLAVRPALLPAFLLGVLVLPAVLLRPLWVVPIFIGITWTSIGQAYLGGLSPVNLGAIVLIPLAVWFARTRLDLARLVILVMTVVGLPAAISGLVSIEGTSLDLDPLKDLVFLPMVALCLRTVRDVDRTVTLLAFVGLFLGLGAAYSVLGQPTTLFPIDQTRDIYGNLPEGAPRAVGPFGEANFFALTMAVLTPFCLYLLTRGGWRALLGAAAVVAIVGGIFATQSRGALLTVGFGVVVMAIAGGSRRLRTAGLFVLAVGAAMVLVFSAQVNTANERTVGGRATENLIAVHMFEDHPLFGVGHGRYPDLYRDYSRHYGDDPRYEREPHSLPLQIAAEQGIVGILGWLAAGYLVLRYVAATGVWRNTLGRALVTAVASYAVASLFLHGSLLRLLYVLIGLVLAYGAALVYERRQPEPQP